MISMIKSKQLVGWFGNLTIRYGMGNSKPYNSWIISLRSLIEAVAHSYHYVVLPNASLCSIFLKMDIHFRGNSVLKCFAWILQWPLERSTNCAACRPFPTVPYWLPGLCCYLENSQPFLSAVLVYLAKLYRILVTHSFPLLVFL